MATNVMKPKVDIIESTPDMVWESNGKRIIDLEDEVFNKVFFTINDYNYNIQLVGDGEKAVRPADPILDEKEFQGWFLDAACQNAFSFDTLINEDTTLYSKWIDVN